jgi:hypothetical protein
MNRLRIDPGEIKLYFESNNWTSIHYPTSTNILVFKNLQFPGRQLTIPVDLSAPDYEDSLSIAINKLSELTEKSVNLILTEIEDYKFDVLRFRISSNEPDQNSIPLSLGHSSLLGVEQAIKSAACSVVQPQVRHAKLNKSESSTLIQHSKMGHTENGSFVIKVSCPLYERIDRSPMLFGEENVPFTRKAITYLATGINKLTTAIQTNTIEALILNIKSGNSPEISKNLCDSIQLFYDDRINNNLEIKLNWSTLLPQQNSNILNTRLLIESNQFSLIDAIGREIAVDLPSPIETYIGTVEELRGEMGPDGLRSGEVILKLFVDDRIVRSRVILDESQYQSAYQAHGDSSAAVRVRGILQPGRQPRTLDGLELFKILD